VVAQWGKTEALEKIWEWAKAEMSTEDLNNKLLLAKDDRKQTVWYYASLWDNLQLLERIWEWAQEQQTREDVNNSLLLVENKYGSTAWQLAAA
jgi:hypothetical protein